MQHDGTRRPARGSALLRLLAVGGLLAGALGLGVSAVSAQTDPNAPNPYFGSILYPNGNTPFGYNTYNSGITQFQQEIAPGAFQQRAPVANLNTPVNNQVIPATTASVPGKLSPAAMALIAANGGPQVTAIVNTGGAGPVASNAGGGYCNLMDGGQIWVPAGADPTAMGCTTAPNQTQPSS
jgi:hypothetical protein